jgi:hypothetical protein
MDLMAEAPSMRFRSLFDQATAREEQRISRSVPRAQLPAKALM